MIEVRSLGSSPPFAIQKNQRCESIRVGGLEDPIVNVSATSARTRCRAS